MTKRKGRKKSTAKKKQEKPAENIDEDQSVEESSPPTLEEQIPEKTLKDLSPTDFPQVGELVVGICTKITTHGAYFNIEGYEILGESTGFVHISELSRTWVRNIRKHIREGQKAVCRVMRVNMQRQEIDLSIRRVTDSQKRETLQIHKQEQRAKGIIKAVAVKLEISDDSIIPVLESHFGNLYSSLEYARDDGINELLKIGLDKAVAEELVSAATKELERSSVELMGKIQISTYDPSGINLIKNSFISASNDTIKKNNALMVQVNVVSAPEYQIKISATDWKIAEKSWLTFQETVKDFFKKQTKIEPLILNFVRE